MCCDTEFWSRVVLAMLDWPFLLFAFLAVSALAFRKQLEDRIARSEILISWGKDRQIKLGELSDEVEKEVDSVREELSALREALQILEAATGNIEAQAVEPSEPTAEQTEAALINMRVALQSQKYRWRSLKRLAWIAGVSESQALEIIQLAPGMVIGFSKTGEHLVRLSDR